MQENDSTMSYQSYVLRLWSDEQDGRPVWRFTLLEAQTGRRLGFDSLSALVEHLDQLTQGGSAADQNQITLSS